MVNGGRAGALYITWLLFYWFAGVVCCKNYLMGRCLKITIHEEEECSEEVLLEEDRPLESLQKYLLVGVAALGC